MELILSNPFRILGLPIFASSREIAKRISDLEMYAELGKQQSYPGDFAMLGSVDRTIESIKNAARKIEINDARFFHAFFYFRSEDTVDELALDCLSNYQLNESLKIWSRQIDKNSNTAKANWRINRALMCLLLNSDSDTSHFEQALEDINLLTSNLFEDVVREIPGFEQVSRRTLRELIFESMIDYAANSRRKLYGNHGIKLIKHCARFSKEGLDFITERVSKPLINIIEDAAHRSKVKRDQGTTVDDLRRKNGLYKVEHLVYELEEALGSENPTFQATANCYADEVIACAVLSINSHKAVPTAIMLAEWASDLPSFGQSRKWILRQRKKIFAWDSDYVSEDDDDFDFSAVEDTLDSFNVNDSDEQVKEPLLSALSFAQKIALFKFFGLNDCSLSVQKLRKRIENLYILIFKGTSSGFISHDAIYKNIVYESMEEDTLENLTDIFNDLGIAVFEDAPIESVEQEMVEEVENLVSTSHKIPKGITICPICYSHFSPDEVIEHTVFGVRCPHCKQSIVL
jgi:hypothetical protein